jgi:hypothetical protein
MAKKKALKGTGDASTPNIPEATPVPNQAPQATRHYGDDEQATVEEMQELENGIVNGLQRYNHLREQANAVRPSNTMFILLNAYRNRRRRQLQVQAVDAMLHRNDLIQRRNRLNDAPVVAHAEHAPIAEVVHQPHTNHEHNSNNQNHGGTGIKRVNKNPWVSHVSTYAKKHNISYFQALKLPAVREAYRKPK